GRERLDLLPPREAAARVQAAGRLVEERYGGRDAGGAGVGGEVAGEDAQQRRLAGAVGAEHGEDGARRGLELDAVERADGTERLDQALGCDGLMHRRILPAV